jgi:hypothetical protein
VKKIKHPDALVVHFRKESNRDNIQSIVKNVMNQYDVRIGHGEDRTGRISSAFDIKSYEAYVNETDNNILHTSHSTTLSYLIAHYFHLQVKRNPERITVKNTVEWLEDTIHKMNQWGVEKVCTEIFNAYEPATLNEFTS